MAVDFSDMARDISTKGSMDWIRIRGARQHNLKNIDLDLPRNQLIVITGVSGSGKSSLAFDTLFAEGQRRYLEALSTRSRQYLQTLDKPDVSEIHGLSPAIAIEQRSVPRNPRSTVGTLSEIHDYLRVLFAHLGTPHCTSCGRAVIAHTIPEILEELFNTWPEASRLLLLAPMGQVLEKSIGRLFVKLRKEGFARIRLDGRVLELDPPPLVSRQPEYQLDVVVDRVVLSRAKQQRLSEAIELAVKMGSGFVTVLDTRGLAKTFSDSLQCPVCRIRMPDLSPSLFSFHHPAGMCPVCKGLGSFKCETPATGDSPPAQTRRSRKTGIDPYHLAVEPSTWHEGEAHPALGSSTSNLEPACTACGGSRLNQQAMSVLLNGLSIHNVNSLPIAELLRWGESLSLSENRARVARPLLTEILQRAATMEHLGLAYLTLSRSAVTLSGGEAQRVRLAQQIGSELTGILYVLDEPSIGLHPHDHQRLLSIIRSLRDAGNTVVVVEHDRDTILQADHVVDMGPGAGALGGHVLFSGSPSQLLAHPTSLTGQYLSAKKTIALPARRVPFRDGQITIHGASGHNLKDVKVQFPLGCITCVTGVSGSGKSTLVLDTLYRVLANRLYRATVPPAEFVAMEGVESIRRVFLIDQSPIGKNPRSTPATYAGIFTPIRQLFAKIPEARARGYSADRFSYNVKGGRCETCRGDGIQSIDLVFLPDVTITCAACGGTRYNPETLQVLFKGHSIADVLSMTVSEALLLLENIPPVRHELEVMQEVGLGYLRLGQSALTLSGGEAQRVKLATQLSLKTSEHTLYVLDEPTTGLHFDDVSRLLNILHRLAEAGHTIILIEHHPDVIKSADYVIDLGPGGGADGGNVVAVGTPGEIAQCAESLTGRYLRNAL